MSADHGTSPTHRAPGEAVDRRPPIWLRVLLPVVLILVWLAVFSLGGMSFGKIGDVATNDRSSFLPASAESTQVQERLGEFLGEDTIPAILVVERPGGLTAADTSALEAVASGAGAAVAPGVDVQVSPVLPSEDGKAAELVVAVPAGIEPETAVAALDALAAEQLPEGLDHWVTGPAGFSADLVDAFGGIDGLLLVVALAVVFVILVIVYRSPLLPVLVLLSSMTALCAAVLVVVALARADVLTINGQIQGILFILVIGAATDYILLYVARFREELRDVQRPVTATLRALRGTIEPIAASGGTVIAGLLCLMLSDLVSNSALGPVAAIGIAMAMATSLTFLPAVLALVGRAAFWPRRPLPGSEHPRLTGDGARGLWPGIGRLIARAPRRIAAGVLIVLVIGCAGLVRLDASGVPASEFVLGDSPARDGQAVIAAHFPGGSGTPTYVIAPADQRADAARVLADADGVSTVALAALDSPSGSIPVDATGAGPAQGPFAGAEPTEVDGDLLFQVTLTDAADSLAAEGTVEYLRTDLAGAGVDPLVGGTTATDLDTNATAERDRTVIIPVVLAAITVMLMLLLRSIVAPLMLLATTVLSYGTALGVAAVVFHLIGQGASDPVVPLYGFVFLVALGIDYNIFLMSRVREESLVHGTHEGVLRGLGLTGGVITSAGIVLAATFAALAVIPIQFLLQLAIIVSFGVLLDALVVRSFLVPALTYAIGDRVWWPAKVPRRR